MVLERSNHGDQKIRVVLDVGLILKIVGRLGVLVSCRAFKVIIITI